MDAPTAAKNRIATITLGDTKGLYAFSTANVDREVKGVRDVYFVFRGTGYNVASWAFSEKTEENAAQLKALADDLIENYEECG